VNIQNLFPTALGQFELGRDLTEREIDFIQQQQQRPNMGNHTSVDNAMLERRELRKLRGFIEASVDQYFRAVFAPRNDVGLRITQSWCNYTQPGQWHHRHAHPNSFISGVLYLQADPGQDRIYFYRDGYQQLRTPTDDFNPWNSESWWMPVGTGLLFVFPSGLTHGVETVQGDNTRISLSFNTFPVGTWGAADTLTGLDL
jgi:uncharacterized protein (TIGR02466 family)